MIVTMRRGGGWAIRGLGDVANPAESAAGTGPIGGNAVLSNFSVSDVVAGAKLWATPSAAIAEIKSVIGGGTLNAARLAGVAAVPLVALMVLPGLFKGGRRRRR